MQFTLILTTDEVNALQGQRVKILKQSPVNGKIDVEIEVVTDSDISRVFWSGFTYGMQRGSKILGDTMQMLIKK